LGSSCCVKSNATATDEVGDEFDAVSIGADDGNTTFAPTSADTKVTFAPTTFEPTTFLPTESPTTFLPTATYPPTNVNGEKGNNIDVVAASEPGAESNMELDADATSTMAPSVATVVVAPPVPTTTESPPTVSPYQAAEADWTDPLPATGSYSGGVTAVGSSSSTRLLVSLLVVSVFVVLC